MAITPTPRFGMKQFSSGADPHPSRLEHNAMIGLIESNAAIYSQGTLAARPTAGKAGRYHWATDTKRLYADDGIAWNEVSPIGGGGVGKPVLVAGTATEGTAERAARADHTHNLPLVTVSANGAMLAADKAKLDKATTAATASTLVLRDAAGAVTVSTPTAATHAATKAYVDGRIQEAADYADDAVYDIPFASATDYGHMSAADKKKLDAATSNNTAGTIVLRNSGGDSAFRRVVLSDAPSAADQATRKDYVDAQVATKASLAHSHLGPDLTVIPLYADTVINTLEQGYYHQNLATRATPDRDYPVAAAGFLEVLVMGDRAYQRYTTSQEDRARTFTRAALAGVWSAWKETSTTDHKHSGADITSGTVSPLRIANATSTLDGLMPKADKGLLNGATSATTGNTLVKRSPEGNIAVMDPSADSHPTNKRYVDTLGAERLEFRGDLGTGSIAGVTARGIYWNAASGPVSVANGYPIDGAAGTLVVLPFGGGAAYMQREWTEWTSGRRWLSATNNTGTTWSSWKEQALTTPATSSANGLMPAADKAKLDAATGAASALTLAMRNESGQVMVGAPTANSHASTKLYVDAETAKRALTSHKHAAGDLPVASGTAAGTMSAADKAKLDAATYLPTNGAIVQRHSTAGTIHVETGDGAKDAANKAYVDGQIGNHKHTVSDLAAGNLAMTHLRLSSTTDASETSTGHAFQIGPDNATNIAIDNNEIIGRVNGALSLISFPGGVWGLPVPLTGSTATNKDYVDGVAAGKSDTGHKHSGADLTSGTIPPARIANASWTVDGLMSKGDKGKLDSANSDPVPGVLVQRDGSGRFMVSDPGASLLDAANKGYVDGAVAPLQNEAVEHYTSGPVAGPGKPAGVPYKHFAGWIAVTTGAGGDVQTATPATNGDGYGGIWFGAQGLPKFSGIYSVHLTHKAAAGYHGSLALDDVNLTRIKYRGARLTGGQWLNAFGTMVVYVDVFGW